MHLKSLLKGTATAALITVLSSASALAAGKFIIVDILPLNSGISLDEATAYFQDVEPILAKHGMTRSDAVLDVTTILRGSAKADVINLWESDNPQASFQGIFSDAEYKTHITNRDRIFNLNEANIIVTERKELHQ